MNKPSKTEARLWLAEFIRQYRASETTIDLTQASDMEIIALMGGEKIHFFKKGTENE